MRLSLRRRAVLDLITSLFFFLAIGVMLWKESLVAWTSVQKQEALLSVFSPPIYPLKVFIALGVLLLLLQGLAKFIRDLNTAIYSRGTS